ncbi:MAG: complex I NDUFA9 subunit family protein [Xanthobacteraceae bacterium]
MTDRIVTVFGGTGLLGRNIVQRLRTHGFRARSASRHPHRTEIVDAGIEAVCADIHDRKSIAAALTGAWGVINSVALHVERGRETFHAVHVEGARAMAELARQAGVERFVNVSGIGADPASPSLYVHKRGEGEAAVQAAFPSAIIVRPGVLFGTDDGFLNTVLGLLRRLPVYPMFGRGETRLQPAAADDVAEAIARIFERSQPEPTLYEFGGPRIYSYEGLLRSVAREAGLTPRLVPFPFAGWHALAAIGELLPRPLVTRNQVELMEVDTVASPQLPGFRELGIEPQAIEDAVQRMARGER